VEMGFSNRIVCDRELAGFKRVWAW
jgi:hypothetical protein